MPIDARIPLGINQYQTDPIGDYYKIMSLKNMMSQGALDQQKMNMLAQENARQANMDSEKWASSAENPKSNAYKQNYEDTELNIEKKKIDNMQSLLENADPNNWDLTYQAMSGVLGAETMRNLPQPGEDPKKIATVIDTLKGHTTKARDIIDRYEYSLKNGLIKPGTTLEQYSQIEKTSGGTEDPYTLPIGAKRYDASGNVIAENMNFAPKGLDIVEIQMPDGRTLQGISNTITGEVKDFQGNVLVPASRVGPSGNIPGAPLAGVAATPTAPPNLGLGQSPGEKKEQEIKAEFGAKRENTMGGIGEIINKAREYLTGGVATQSGVGTALDYAAGIVGVAPEGAKEADALRALGGALISKMPRMEGPQSDFDVKNYEKMAGRVGDSTLPVERRLEALKIVEEIWKKYEKVPEQHRRAADKAVPRPKKGDRRGGYVFMGGDPNDKKNWMKE